MFQAPQLTGDGLAGINYRLVQFGYRPCMGGLLGGLGRHYLRRGLVDRLLAGHDWLGVFEWHLVWGFLDIHYATFL